MRPYFFTFLIIWAISGCVPTAQKDTADLSKLVSYLEGSYSSERQSLQDSSYFHITLDMKRIWPENTDGAWLYVEQTAASSPGRPYRQRIYQVRQTSDTTFTSSIYSFSDPKPFIGAHLQPEMLNAISADSLKLLQGCDIFLSYVNGVFQGSTKEGQCANAWGEATYATSEVVLYADHMVSWDRGYNDAHEQVWGAEKGGYQFDKINPAN